MAATFNWSVPNTEYTKADGGIFTVHWRCDASDGDYSASSYGTAGFSQDPESDSFIPYDQLTEADVLGWVWNDGVDKESIEASLQSKIDANKNPTTANGVPW